MNLDFTLRSPRPGPMSWLLFGFGLIAAAWTMLAWQQADAARSEVEQRITSLHGKTVEDGSAKWAAKPKRADTSDSNSARSHQRGNDAARSQLSLPWARLLDTLQITRSPEIAFLSLDADGQRGDFTLAAQARNQAAMIDFFNQMQHAPGMTQVSLSRHELRPADGEQAVYFSLRGMWVQP